MATEFRKQKYIHAFNTFFDVDKSGDIDKSDFDQALKKVATFRGWPEGSPNYNECKKILEDVWNGLKSHDADADGKVSQAEWIALWDKFAKDPSSVTGWQNSYSKFIFKIVDTSDDGSIDAEEFSSLFAAFGLVKDEAAAAFKKASEGKPLTFEGFQKLWSVYFSSDDKNAPGNFIFGKSSF